MYFFPQYLTKHHWNSQSHGYESCFQNAWKKNWLFIILATSFCPPLPFYPQPRLLKNHDPHAFYWSHSYQFTWTYIELNRKNWKYSCFKPLQFFLSFSLYFLNDNCIDSLFRFLGCMDIFVMYDWCLVGNGINENVS